jgi:cell division transport system permease protein
MSKPVDKRGASSHNVKLSSRIKMFFYLHKLEIKNSFDGLVKTPIASFMTLMVLGIALALPGGLQVIIKNSSVLTQGWEGASKYSLFIKDSVSEQALIELKDKLMLRSDVSSINLITKAQALEEFQAQSGLGNALEQLDDNPLPAVLEVQPESLFNTPEASESMLEDFKALPEVEIAQLDMQWVKRLYFILELAERSVSALAILLGVAVLLIVGNTIRLAIQSRREEIEIIKLIGATNAFIRRPFLYTGLWYGVGSGIIAILLIAGALFWLDDPVSQLAMQYDSGYQLTGLSFEETMQLLGFSTLLGLLGSWISVTRHLQQINPT